MIDGMKSDQDRFFSGESLSDRISDTVNILCDTQSISFQFKLYIDEEDADMIWKNEPGL